MLRLSENFKLSEFTKSSTALRLGIDNTPDSLVVENLSYLANKVLQPVRDHFGKSVSIRSGFRSLPLNRELKSEDTSQHILGYAADIEIVGVDNKKLAEWIRDNLEFDQLILEFYDGTPDSGWVHVSVKEVLRNRQECLTINKGSIRRGLIG